MEDANLSLPELLEVGAKEFGIDLSPSQIDAILADLREVAIWNCRMNLTAITDMREMVIRHALDSLSCSLALDLKLGDRVIDVGTGAGFPGIPLKIWEPGIELVLLDSVGKRLGFLDHLISLLHLAEARTVHARAEDAARLPEHRERYDIVLARAVSALPTLAELCLPLAKIGGVFLAMKGPAMAEEVSSAKSAIAQLGGKIREVRELALPFGGGARSLILIEKIRPTPAAFPRKAGIPARAPLGIGARDKNG